MNAFWKKLLMAAAILAVGLVLISLGRLVIRRLADRRTKRKKGTDAVSPSGQKTIQSLGISIFNFLMYFFLIVLVLKTMGVDVSSLLAVAGVGGIAIGFGCQTLVKDFISGMFLWIDGYLKVGDVVTIGALTGTVESVALRTTRLRGSNGNIMVIPNGDIRTVINMTRDYRCAIVDLTVAHGQDYRRAIEVLKKAMDMVDFNLAEIDSSPQVVGIISSDGRAATIRIEMRCDIADCWKIEREIRLCALECFRNEGIKP